MDRRALLGIVAAIAVISAAVGWFAGQRIKSPAEIAAGQEPPEPSLITVPVELRTLSQNVVVRGTIRPSDQTDLTVAATDAESVITRLSLEAGDSIDEGDVVVEVAGRPVIALQGTLPAFRNLIPGLDGPDVQQLESALVRLGYDPGPVDTTYSPATASAVEALYRDRGYTAPEADESERGALRTAEDTVETVEESLTQARDSLSEARKPVTALERQQLDLAVSQAEVDLERARADASTTKADAAAAVTTAEQERASAATEATNAADRLGRARGGTHPDTGQAPTAEELKELEEADAAARRALTDADATLTAAREAKPRIENEQNVAVTAAEVRVAEAEQERTDRLNPPSVAGLQTRVSEAEQALTEARGDVTEARSRVGAWIPTTEVLFLTSVPRTVASVSGELGAIPSGPVMTISGAETVIESGVSAADRRLIEVGAEAVLEDDDLGIAIDAVVTLVADKPGGGQLSSDRYAMRLEPSGDLPEDAIGLNLRISIPITSSGGDVLAVPLAALSAGPDGTARVEREGNSGQTELVEVSTGLRAEGFVEIEAIEAELAEGDRVVVGRDLDLGSTRTENESDDESNSEPDDESNSEPDEESNSEPDRVTEVSTDSEGS